MAEKDYDKWLAEAKAALDGYSAEQAAIEGLYERAKQNAAASYDAQQKQLERQTAQSKNQAATEIKKTERNIGQTLASRGLAFSGELEGEDACFDFCAKSLYSLTFSTEGFLEFYYSNDYYMIVPDGKSQGLIKWTLAAEEIHNLYDEKWRSACADVYGIGEKVL